MISSTTHKLAAMAAVIGCSLFAANVAAQFEPIVDDFSGGTLSSDWGENAVLNTTEYHSEPASMELTSPSAAEEDKKTSTNGFWSHGGWPENSIRIKFWTKDMSSSASTVHINVGLSSPGGSHGWYNWIGMYPLPVTHTGDWVEVDAVIADLGLQSNVWETVNFRTKVSNKVAEWGLTESECPIILTLNLGVTGGTTYYDDFNVVEEGTSPVVSHLRRIVPAHEAVRIAGEQVSFASPADYTLSVLGADGRVVRSLRGHGSVAAVPASDLAAGSYLIRVKSSVGDAAARMSTR